MREKSRENRYICNAMNIIHLLSNKTPGNAETYVLDLCRAHEKAGHSTAVVSRYRNPEITAPFAAAGIPVGHLPLRGAFDFISPSMLSRVLDRMEAPVAVHVHNFKDALVALRARRLLRRHKMKDVRVVCTIHNDETAGSSRQDSNIYAELDAFIFLSDASRKTFLSTATTALRHSGRLRVIPGSVLPSETSVPSRKEERPFTFIYIGSLTLSQGIDVMLQAFEKVNEERPGRSKLVVAGSGESRFVMPLVRKARGRGFDKAIEWLGQREDSFDLLDSADALLLPARGDVPCPLAAVAAMSRGVPVIGSATGGIPELVRDGKEAILLPPGDASALAAAMIRAIDNPEDLREKGEAALARYTSDFDFERLATRVKELYVPAP